ncbi:schlafen family member 9-like [Emydura macquarii macquarii]|uniref:schlafen family member 9-like n=1 Tax=Emydura macquarii macquarii TaxID=1129001 RepID=UPI00352A641B
MMATENCLYLDEVTNYPDVVVEVGKVTFGEKSRNKMQDGNRKKKQIGNISRAACALLNSGGGVIKAEIENEDYNYEIHGIGQDIEISLTELIPSKMFLKYFDCIQENNYFLIFVKSWSSEDSSSPRICSLGTGLYRRSVSSINSMSPNDAAQFLKEKQVFASRKHDEETGTTAKKPLLSNIQQEQNMYVSAERFYQRDVLLLGEKLNFTESTHVEFKQFGTKNILKYTKGILPKYISGFANTQGGFLFIGVEDNGTVVGCKKEQVDINELNEVIQRVTEKLPISHICSSQPEVKLECKMLKVYDNDQNLHGYVCAVRIQPFCCVVFSDTPDSWTVKDNKITRMTAHEWITLMMATDPEISNLYHAFTTELSVSCKPPLTKTVFSNKNLTCLRELQETLFPVNGNGITYRPDDLSKELFSEHPGLEDLMKEQMEELQCSQGLLIFERSWGVPVGLPENRHVVCDALLIAAGKHPTLYTVTEYCSEGVFEYSRWIARVLKQKLVNDGGYTQKVCVIPHLLHYGTNRQRNNDSCLQVKYPFNYVLFRSDMSDLFHSLLIILLSFRSFLSDQLGCEFFNLLTIRQYEILTKNLHKFKKLFIYGLPGTGKTVVALNIIERIKNVFHCESEEILYICENQPLKAIVEKRNICQSVTRVAFLKGNYYQSVKHIVIDEAQNFQTEDGDWYRKAQCITQGNGHRKPGVLWIFLDYLQTSHVLPCGLPDPSEQYPQEWLTVGVRNATQIHAAMLQEMKNIVEYPQIDIPSEQLKMLIDEAKCGHPLPGVYRVKENLTKDEIATYVVDTCFQYFRSGYSGKDIAILCNTVEETDEYRCILLRKIREKMRKFRLNAYFRTAADVMGNGIVLDSIRRFSGLERNIVFGINPVPTQKKISDNLKLCVASRANLQLHLLYEG